MTLKVDTFEQDIAEEIKRKDASLTEIASAKKDIGDDTPPPKQIPPLVIALVGATIFAVLGLVGLGYYYFTDPLLPPSQGSVPVSSNDVPKKNTELTKVSETLSNEIGMYVSSVEKQEKGYVLNITNYAPVFSYMTRNETSYINDLAALFPAASKPFDGSVVVQSTTTASTSTAVVATSTATSSASTSTKPTTSSKTKVATTTAKTSTTTKATTSTSTETTSSSSSQIFASLTPANEVVDARFSDLTLSNQNMRVWTSGNHRVVYSFLGTNKILISDSPERILAMKSAILR